MAELPKLVRERLRTTASATTSHPGANLLTAFAEQSLRQHERAQVIAHLAHCADCREVVALALPVREDQVILSPERGNWFRLPVLRWAAIAAGIAVAVSVGTVEYRGRQMKQFRSNVISKRETVAALEQSSAVPQMETHKIETQMSAPKANASNVAKQADEARTALASGTAAAKNAMHSRIMSGSSAASGISPAAGAAVRSSTPTHELAKADSPKPEAKADVLIADSSQPAAPSESQTVSTESVEVSSAVPTVQTEEAQLSNNREVSKAKAMNKSSAAASTPIMGRNVSALQTLAPSNVALRWTISVTGTLQRSFDGGTTWQDVSVAPNDSMNANLTMKAKVAKEKAATGGAVFRAVCATGMEVWAGGSGGVLYHTVDAGNSWARVVPSFEGIVLGGDIVSIQFPDPQHGQISTSTSELWTTADSGQSWRKLK
jgi:hypothetical protein